METISLAGILKDSAERHSDKIAIKIGDEVITYRNFLHKSLKVANTLKEIGNKKGAVGIVGQRHMASYVGILGALLAGCYYVPINPKFSKDKIVSIIKKSSINSFIGDIDSFADIDPSVFKIETNSTIKKLLPFQNSPKNTGWIGQKDIDNKKCEIDLSHIEKHDLAYTIYTSGSTGEPKGVPISNFNILSWIQSMAILHRFESGFKASQVADLSFDFSVSELFHTWANGGVLCILPEQERLNPSDFIIRESIEVWSSVPSLLSFMSKMGILKKNIFPSIRFSFFCGEPLPINLAKEWSVAAANTTVENFYGPTEATVWFTIYTYKKSEKEIGRNGILAIGVPFPMHRVEVIAKDGAKVSEGEVGELVYKGPQLTNGYLDDDQKTESVFVQFDWDRTGDTWYKSGDLGFVNDSGDLECVGRVDSQIKIGGRRVEIGEIEAGLSKFKLLQDVIVVPVKDERQVIIGCVAFTMNVISKEEKTFIQKASGQYLERIFFPKKIISITEYPYLSSGKVDRKSLAELAQTAS